MVQILATSSASDPEGTDLRGQATETIKNLPVEILVEVFLHTLSGYTIPNRQSSQAVLCSVCQHWRTVALTTPVLWASIKVMIFTARSLTPHYLQFLSLWLNRSHRYPLSIYFIHGRGNPNTRCNVFSLFLTHIQRWRDINLSIYSQGAVDQLLAARVEGEPLLETLDLRSDQDLTPPQAKQLPIFFQSFPRLSQLIRWTLPSSILMELPCSQLTKVHLLGEVPMADCVAIIRQCLRAVDILFYDVVGPLVPLSPRTVHPTIESLFLGFRLCEPRSILVHILCPNLHDLSLMTFIEGQAGRPTSAGDLDEFLTLSRCALKKLHLTVPLLLEDDVAAYLTILALRSLQHLYISCYRTNDSTIRRLTASDDSPLLPSLKVIALRFCSSMDGLIADMVASRRDRTRDSFGKARVSQLESLIVTFHAVSLDGYPLSCGQDVHDPEAFLRYHTHDVDRFRHFIADGMDVQFKGF